MRQNNLIGNEYGKLTVIAKAESRKGRGFWLCQCECGNIKEVRTDALKEGKTKSCGCYSKECLYNRNKSDLVGQVFGKLTVLEETSQRDLNTRSILWKCRCQCGREILVPTRNLTTHHTQSCGCMKSQGEYIIANILNKNNISFDREKTFSTCIFKETGKKARFDFYVDNKYIIEFDGKQHFESYGSGWFTKETYQKTIEHDQIKNQWCEKNNIPLIRIPYTYLNQITLEDLIPETSNFLYKI